ncbi:MAG: 16S rRNA (cytidine(1402)-2'-O)-methyltransferase [Deltaproteobacteria bacterium]|nr:16S rRNA (cytidine(1402)-2'-O)-methyltransferase [Deltaproteobacteria bacterium]
MAGTLFVVATPIGNLEDVTARARRILDEVDWVACEDTRRTRILLTRLGLRCRLTSLWQATEEARTARLLRRLLAGERGALVSDGGTPLVSDPGFLLVHAARNAGVPVIPIPGPCAAVAALSAAGLPPIPFIFLGFPPRNPGRLRRRLAALRALEATLIFYESPERVATTLRLAREVLGEREAVVARELTKLHEEFLAGCLGELAERLALRPPRGEVTLLVAGAPGARAAAQAEEEEEPAERRKGAGPQEIGLAVAGEPGTSGAADEIRQALARGTSPRDAAREVAARLGIPRREAYAMAIRLAGDEEE